MVTRRGIKILISGEILHAEKSCQVEAFKFCFVEEICPMEQFCHMELIFLPFVAIYTVLLQSLQFCVLTQKTCLWRKMTNMRKRPFWVGVSCVIGVSQVPTLDIQ